MIVILDNNKENKEQLKTLYNSLPEDPDAYSLIYAVRASTIYSYGENRKLIQEQYNKLESMGKDLSEIKSGIDNFLDGIKKVCTQVSFEKMETMTFEEKKKAQEIRNELVKIIKDLTGADVYEPKIGEDFDVEKMESLDIRYINEIEKDGKVESIVRPGFTIKTLNEKIKVILPAKVIVYKYGEKETGDKKLPESQGERPEEKEAEEINKLLEKTEKRINSLSQFADLGIFDNAIKSVKLQIENKNYEAAKEINELIWEIVDPAKSKEKGNDSIHQRLRKILEVELEGGFYKKKEIDFIPKIKPEDVLKEYKSLKEEMDLAGKGIDIVIPTRFYEKLPKLIENKKWETAGSIIIVIKDMLKDKRLRKLREMGF